MRVLLMLMPVLLLAQPAPPPPPSPPRVFAPAEAPPSAHMSEESLYSYGTRAIDRRQWDRAAAAFELAAAKNGSRAQGAHYWKAYALARLARSQEALAALRDLESRFPKSRWIDDAKALEIEIQQATGKPVSPEEQQNEELKLIAIHSLSGQDPARAVPLLEKVLAGKGSISLKSQALFVLSQVRHPRTREVLFDYAKGKGNPDLQMRAIEILGMTSSSNAADLIAIYNGNPDKHVKRSILNALSMQRDAKPLIEIARTEKDPELLRDIVHRLSRVNSKEATDFLSELLEK